MGNQQNETTRAYEVERGEEAKYGVSILDLAKLLLKNWLKIAIVTVLAAIIGFCIGQFLVTPKYMATVKVTVIDKTNDAGKASYSDYQKALLLIKDCRELIESYDTLDLVVNDASHPEFAQRITTRELASKVSFENLKDTRTLRISVTDADKEFAADLAESIYAVAKVKVADILDISKFEKIDSAENSISKVTLGPVKSALIGALLGFIITCAVVIIVKMFDNKVTTPDDVTKLTDLPLLATIPYVEHSDTGVSPKRRKE